jgi:hypothetical protein
MRQCVDRAQSAARSLMVLRPSWVVPQGQNPYEALDTQVDQGSVLPSLTILPRFTPGPLLI